MLRWLKRIVIGVLALTIVLTGALMIVLHTDWGRDKIRSRVEAALADSFPGGATIGTLEGSVFGELVVRDVRIAATDGKPAITVGTVRVRLGLRSLFTKTARVDRLVAEDVKIALGGAPLTKKSETPDAAKPGVEGTGTSSGGGWSLELPAIEVHRGTLEIAGDRPIALDGLELTGELEKPSGAPMTGFVRVHGTWRERTLPIDLAGQLKLDSAVGIAFATISVGDVQLTASDVVVDPDHFVGSVNVTATPEAIAAVMPELELPAGVRLAIVANGDQLDLAGALGNTELRGTVRANLKAKTAAGILGASNVDVAELSNGKATGHGSLTIAFDASMLGAHGVVGLQGAYGDLPTGDATVLFDAKRDHADVTVFATSVGELRSVTTAKLSWKGKQIDLDRARVVATVIDASAASGGRAPITGALRADVSVTKKASLSPALDVELAGNAWGRSVTYEVTSVGVLDATFGAHVTRTKPATGQARTTVIATGDVTATNIRNAGKAVGSGTAHAEYKPDGRIFAKVHGAPAAADLVADVTGWITPGEVTDIKLVDHVIKPAAASPWSGVGGVVTITKQAITVRGLTTTNGDGRVTVTADVGRGNGAIDAKLDATGVPVAAIDATYHGHVSGAVTIKRRGTKWNATGKLAGTGLVFRPDDPAFDGDVDLEVDGRHVTAAAAVKSPGIGGVKLVLDLDGPRDITNIPAWRLLDRSAVHEAKLTVDHVDLASVSPTTGGSVDGNIVLAGAATTGQLDIRGVVTPIGSVEGKLSFAPLDRDVFASGKATVSELGEANLGVQITFPEHVFDPIAWKTLGRGVVQSLTASFDDLAIDPARLAKLGVKAPLKGHANVHLAVGSAAAMATLTVGVTGVEGGPLVRPLDATFTAKTDSNGTTATGCVARGATKDTRGGACAENGLAAVSAPPRLLTLDDFATPVTFDRWLTAPKAALTATLTGKIVIPSQDAAPVLAVLGRTDFASGKLDGLVTVDGVIRQPTGHAVVQATNMRLVSAIAGRTIPVLNTLKVDATWRGLDLGGTADVDATESNKGELHAHAEGKPDQLATIVATLRATAFDLAPITAFLPGSLAAASGTLRGKATVTSLDPATRTIIGDLHLTNGQIPIIPIIGTLRDTTADLAMFDHGITLKANGILGAARTPNVRLDAEAPSDLSKLDGKLVLTHVSPLAEFEPRIDATIDAHLTHSGKRWTGDLVVSRARVRVPPPVGDKLLAAAPPEDLFDIEHPPDVKFGLDNAREPVSTWLTATLTIERTPVEFDVYDVEGAGAIVSKNLTISIGDTVGLDGVVAVVNGKVNIVGRDWDVIANDTVTFRGTIDPEIDLEIKHSFSTMTLTAIERGNLSDADFPHKPEFVADPPRTYTQDQMFDFFLGGEPSDDTTTSQTQAIVTAVGTSYVSSKLSQRLKKFLPAQLKLDVIKCEPGTSTASASCTAGRWFFDHSLYVAGKRHLTPRPDENIDDIQAQYYLSREWLFEGTGGDRAYLGADLLWRRRW